MNKFLKLAIIPIAFLVTGTATSCSVNPKEIALITDVGDIDDGSFNQESWEAVKQYAGDNNKSYDFYRPFNDSDFARNCAVKQAVAKGAKIIILPGFKFAPTCATVMGKYPDVHFLLIDSFVHNGNYNPIDPELNTCCIGFKCEYSGFIAGYTIATDLMQRDFDETGNILGQYGYGYVGGMATSGVYEFGYGYIQGICRATADFCQLHKIEEEKMPKILINYDYAGVFAQHDPTAIKVKSWYSTEGIKVVFPCGGKLYQSVTEAAQYYNKHNLENYQDWYDGKLDEDPRDAARWVGVDSDQYRGLTYDYELKSIYTSALKGLNPAIMNALDLHYKNEWNRIGGNLYGKTTTGEVDPTGKWILGLNSVFGNYDKKDAEDHTDDYVGIPDVYDEETGLMRGFNNFKYDNNPSETDPTKHEGDFIALYEKLTTASAGRRIPVCGDSGAVLGEDQKPTKGGWCDHDLDIHPGYPYEMDKWMKDEMAFREVYLGKYPENKIEIHCAKH